MGNFVPWRDAAWALLSERIAVLSSRCAQHAEHDSASEALRAAAEAAGAVSARLAEHVPIELRPA